MKIKIIARKYFIIFFFPLVFISCDKGLEPSAPVLTVEGFKGTVNFVSAWPDSAIFTVLAVFQNPLLSAADFNVTNIKFVSNPIVNKPTTFSYNSLTDFLPLLPENIKAGEYSYVAVIQSASATLSLERRNWYIVGVYYAAGDTTKPGKLVIPSNTVVDNINIRVDFNNLPPQPPL